MLSILIPTYNYNAYSLAKEIHDQASLENINFEIICIDDGSNSKLNNDNQKINTLKYASFQANKKNIGRSAIRNLLAKQAKFKFLLFLDSGTYPKGKNYIKKYIKLTNKSVVFGGMSYIREFPPSPFKLRWIYTKKRERKKGIHSCNFLIKKKIFENIKFDESLFNYGYEDVLFFNTLKKEHITIDKIDNPVVHMADDDALSFIKKNEDAIHNLINLIEIGKLDKNLVGISKYYYKLRRVNLDKFLMYFFKLTKPILKNNLTSNHPSLIIFDFYRLGYYCLLKNNK